MPLYVNTTRTNEKVTKPAGRAPLFDKIYIGFVRDHEDPAREGRLGIFIPEFGNTVDDPSGLYWCSYLSPFAGSTNDRTIGNNERVFDQTQTSYGFWMIPPDINSRVAVFFANGDSSQGYWFGCAYHEFSNHMVPGLAASTNNYRNRDLNLPVAEHNKKTSQRPTINNTTRPVNETVAEGLRNQGLALDPLRGPSQSSAKRESPSQVFGISTPGPILKGTTDRRTGGHQFVMDDLEGNEHITLRTKSGAQIKLDETNGFTYIINKKGTAWVQLDADGNIDIFSAKSMSIRSQEDINLRADKNINIEAGNDINLKAAKDWSGQAGSAISSEFGGAGGNIKIQANANLDIVVAENTKATTTGNVDIKTEGNNTIEAVGSTDIKSGANHSQESGGNTSIKSGANLNSEASGSWTAKGGPDITMSAGAINLNGVPAPSAGSAKAAASALTPVTSSKTNVLPDFMNNSSKQDKQYYERKTQDGVKTIVQRFPTFEPSPVHKE